VKTINDVTDQDITRAFDTVAGDLLLVCQHQDEESRIHIGDAADAVFNYLQLGYTKDAFPKIKKVLRKQYIYGKKQYIEL